MKVAFLTPRMIVGGAETYILSKCNWLIRHGDQAIILSEWGENVKNIPLGVKHYIIQSISNPPYALSHSARKNLIFTISSILLEEKVDIIEAHNSFPIIYTLLSYKYHKKPFILNVLNEEAYVGNFQLSCATVFLNRHKLYFTLTSQMNQYIEKKIRMPLSPFVIQIPIEVRNTNDAFEEPYILSVCRMSRDKMYVKHLIKGFAEAKLSKAIPSNITLIIVGEGILFNEISLMVEELNNNLQDNSIILKGTVVGDDLHKLYKHCLFYVGMGITLLTAAAYEKACLLVGMQCKYQPFVWGYWGNNPSIDKNSIVANRSYTNGILYKDAIALIVNNSIERHEMARKAFSLFTVNYSISSVMNEWQMQYRRVQNTFSVSNMKYIVCMLNLFNSLVHPIYVLFKKLQH